MTDYTDKRFVEYKEKLAALRPIDSNEKAREYDRLFREYYPRDPKKDRKRPKDWKLSAMIDAAEKEAA